MKKCAYIKGLLSVVFTAMVLFTVNVHQIHYLFAEHHAHHDECNNHLHSEDEHTHCEICQFDISLFDDQLVFQNYTASLFFNEVVVADYAAPLLVAKHDYTSLRGPPAFA